MRDEHGPTFQRRTLSIAQFFLAWVRLTLRLPRLLAIHLTGRRLRPPWREALWLAVTEVNGCRFCSYIHEGLAGAAGLSADDVALLLASSEPSTLSGLDDRETGAIAYAKVWTETAGSPPDGARQQIRETLTAREDADLHALLPAIDFANRAGNTADSLLHRLRHPRRLLQPWGLLNDLVVGVLVGLFGWPPLVLGAVLRRRNRARAHRS